MALEEKKLKPLLYIRCDASAQIGLGHVVRCTALAEMLKEKFDILFFCKEIPESFKTEFNFIINHIKTENEFLEHVNSKSIVVLDGYHFSNIYQKRIKDAGAMLICIVDLPNQEFVADLLINHSPGSDPLDYRGQEYTHFAFGSEYALLRPPFLYEARKERVILKIDSVIICFGGSDSLNLTDRTLAVVQNYKIFKKIILVVGSLYAHLNELKATVDIDSRIELHRDIGSEQLLQLLLQAQLAIVPASGTLMESIATGNRIISGVYVENQKLVYEAFKRQEAFADAGNFSINEIHNAVENVLSKNNRTPKIIDGRSNERLLKKFEQVAISNDLTLRIATGNDAAITYNWAKNPAIRAFSFQQKEINWAEHSAWFNSKIHSEKCIYLIVELYNEAIGSVRFDFENGETLISYLVDHRFHSMGYGLIMLAKSFKLLKQLLRDSDAPVQALVGYVMPTNYPSIKTFVNLGFRKTEEDGKLKFIKHV